MKRLAIGIAGGSGSGKTHLMECLQTHFPDESLCIKLENYYKDSQDLTSQQLMKQNYDDPAMLDMALLKQNLTDWKAGRCSDSPIYSFVGQRGRASMVSTEARQLILVSGAQLFTDRNVRSLLDMKIYVETSEDLRLVRRLKRDVNEFGLSLDTAAERYFTNVKPMYEQFVHPSRHFADFILTENDTMESSTDRLLARIRRNIRS